MSEIVELHRRGIEAVNESDFDAVLELVDPDVSASPLIASIQGTPYRGFDGIRQWWDDIHGSFPDFRLEIAEIRVQGDVTIAALHARGQGSGSAVPLDWPMWQVIRWRNGKCLSWRTFRGEAEALEAAGLSE